MSTLTWCDKKVSRLKFAFFSWMARRLPSCREILPLISQNLDGPLPFGKKIKLVLHKYICEWCRRYEDQLILMRKMVQLKSADDRSSSESPLSPEARERMKRSLNQS